MRVAGTSSFVASGGILFSGMQDASLRGEDRVHLSSKWNIRVLANLLFARCQRTGLVSKEARLVDSSFTRSSKP